MSENFDVLAILRAQTGDFTKGFKEAQSVAESFQSTVDSTNMGAIDKAAAGFDVASKTMSRAGSALTLGVTAPVLAIATAAVKTGNEFEAQMSRVEAISGATGGEMALLEQQAKDLGAQTAFSASEAAAGMENMASAGFNTSEIMASMGGVLDLAAVSGGDVAMASENAATAVRGFGLEASEAGHVADVFAKAAADTNAEVADMGEAMKYVAPVASSLGLSIEETAAAIGIMSDAGIKGSQAGTTLRGALSRLAKPTDVMQAKMDELGISFFDAEGNMKPLDGIISDLEGSFEGLTKEQQANAMVTLFGQESLSGMMALVDAGPGKMQDLTGSFEDADGAADAMARTMQDNAKGSIDEMMGSLETLAITVSETLAPMVREAAEYVTDLANQFGELDPNMQENILKWIGIAAAAGPALKILGTASSVIGPAIKLFSGLATAGGVGATALGAAGTAGTAAAGGITAAGAAGLGATGAVSGLSAIAGPAALAVAGVGLAGYGVYKYLSDDAIPAVDLFGDTVSSNTQSAVSDFFTLQSEAQVALDTLNWGGQTVSQEMATQIGTIYTQMKDQVVATLNLQKDESLASIRDMIAQSTTLTQEEKDSLLGISEQSYVDQEAALNAANARKLEILNTAAAENRTLTEAENAEITRLNQNMQTTAVRVLSESEAEQMAIMERLKANAGVLTAEQAAEVVQNSIGQRDQTVAVANDEYMQRLAAAAQLRAEGGAEATAAADKIVEEATRQKDEAILKAQEMHQGVVDEATAQAGEHATQVDWETGEIKTKWQILKEKMAQHQQDMSRETDLQFGNIAETSNTKSEEAKTNSASNFNQMEGDTTLAMEGVKTAVALGMGGANTEIQSWNGTFSTSGTGLIDSISSSIRTGAYKVSSAVSEVMAAARQYLPFSPAKKGPMSDLDKLNFGGTIADSIYRDENKVSSALASMLAMPSIDYAALDVSSLMSKVTREAELSLAGSMNASLNMQPAYVTLNMGGRSYKAFVEDISGRQNHVTQLEENYLGG